MFHGVQRARMPMGHHLLAIGLFLSLSACLSSGPPPGEEGGAEPLDAYSCAMLAPYEGQVLVLLMGKSGCPGTEEGTRFLREYSKKKPDGVSIVRIEIPPPGKNLEKPAGWDAGFPCEVDRDRQLAEKFDFFYYPTLFIIDRDGEVRFRGGCKGDEVIGIVDAVNAEKPGEPKRLFTAPLPAIGEKAAAFAGTTIDGVDVTFDNLRGEKATLLVFSSLTCPFSREAMECLPEIRSSFEKKGTSVIVVNEGGTAESARPFYRSKVPGVTVVIDPDRFIGGEEYGVQTVPFFYAIDGQGKIALRGPFSKAAARGALDNVLGISNKPVKIEKSGAG